MINTEALRKKVIDLAIQGKLTEQLPSDGDAESLYAQIQEEKIKLVKEGKIKKEKPLKSIEGNEVPFEIPANWMWVRLTEISYIINGDRSKNYPAKSTLSSNGIPFISALNLNGKSVDDDERLLCLSEEQYNKLGSGKLQKDDIVICIRGSLGKHGRYPFDRGAIASSLVICRPHIFADEIGSFIMIWLDASMFPREIDKYDGGSAQPNLAAENLKKFLVPLPPLEEQKRIVEKLDTVLAQIDIIDALQQQYESDLSVLKSKIIDAGIRGKLTKQVPEDGDAETLYAQIKEEKAKLVKEGKIKKEKPLPEIEAEEIPFEIPKNWKWVRIANIGLTVTGTTPPKTDAENYGGAYQFFKPSDLDLGRHISAGSESLTEEGWKVSRQLEKGTILVCCIGSIGKCAIIDVDGTTNQQINALTPIICDSDYLLYAINSDSFQNQLQQGSRATTVTIIKKSKFDECIIPLPPIKEQKRIAVKIDEMLCMMKLCQR